MIKIKRLNDTDRDYARQLLEESELPCSDIENGFVKLFSIHDNNQIIGIIGFEQYRKHGLLRSFVIEKNYRSKGLGTSVLNDFEKMALEFGIEEFYLLTTSADKFFAQNGYEIYNRDTVPELITKTTEFNSLCPASAVCMRKIL